MSRYRRQLKLIYIFVDILSMYVYIMHILRDKKIVNKKNCPTDRQTVRSFCVSCVRKKKSMALSASIETYSFVFFFLSLSPQKAYKEKERITCKWP